MIHQMIIGTILIAMTVIIHAFVLDKLIKFLGYAQSAIFRQFKMKWRMVALIIVVSGVFCSHIVQIWIWTLFYLVAGASLNLEEALYYSTSAYTTAGFGDGLLTAEWRLLGAFQSANGFLLFGWSTAFIFEVMSRLYQRDSANLKQGKF